MSRTIAPAERSLLSPADRRQRGTRVVLAATTGFAVVALAIAGLGPLLWLAQASLSTTQAIISTPLAPWPSGIHWENIPNAWNKLQIGRYTLNTVIMAGGTVIASLLVSVTGGYVLGVLRPRYAGVLTAFVLATLFVPAVVSLVPLYLTVVKMPILGISLLDTYWAVWLPASASAFNVVLVKQFFGQVPRELFEAARIDGAGPLRVLWSILLPMTRPVLGVVVILTFVSSWKDFLWPLLALPSADKQPLSVGLARAEAYSDQILIMAGMFIAAVIPVLIFLVFQKQFLNSASAQGGIKE